MLHRPQQPVEPVDSLSNSMSGSEEAVRILLLRKSVFSGRSTSGRERQLMAGNVGDERQQTGAVNLDDRFEATRVRRRGWQNPTQPPFPSDHSGPSMWGGHRPKRNRSGER